MLGVVAMADAMVTAITAGMLASDDTEVRRAYLPAVVDPEFAEKLTRRVVYVVPFTEKQADNFTRGEDLNEYGVGVLVVNRYTGDEPNPPDSWTDEQVSWVETYVYGQLQDPRTANEPAAVTALKAWCETADVTVYDPDLLRAHKLFWSELSFAFRKAE